MTDRIYYRANFSNVTTPTSSGARRVDEEGNEYASIPIQLPANLISQSVAPKGIEMMLTKLDVPLSNIPLSSIPIKSIGTGIRTRITTKGLISCWPFRFDGMGTLRPTTYSGPMFNVLRGNQWRVQQMALDFNGQHGCIEYEAKLQKMKREMEFGFENVDSLCQFFTSNFQKCLNETLKEADSTHFSPKYYYPSIVARNNVLVLQYVNRGCPYTILPAHDDVFSTSGSVTQPTRTWVRVVSPTGEQTTHYTGSDYISCYSIVVNKCVRDLFPGLPWRRVDNSVLSPFTVTTSASVPSVSGQSIPTWEALNDGDSMMYVLDTTKSDLNITNDEVRSVENLDPTINNSILSAKAEFIFQGYNALSSINISSFIVVLDGISLTQQTFPVNVSPNNASSAQLGVIPIIENFFPQWNSINDLSTNMVVIKDAFTNAAPILLDRTALFERNMRFSVYYITKDGKMHLLTMKPGTVLSIQICYSYIY